MTGFEPMEEPRFATMLRCAEEDIIVNGSKSNYNSKECGVFKETQVW